MIFPLIARMYPELEPAELRKFSLLALVFFLIIGSYWVLGLLKDVVFFTIAFPESLGWAPQQGRIFQPHAQLWAGLVAIISLMIYSKLTELVRRHQLFYIICSFYTLVFGIITLFLATQELYGAAALGKTALAATGWITHFAVDSFITMMVALFWSFTNSITTTDSAKRGFALIVAAGQGGALAASGLVYHVKNIGILWPVFLLATCTIASIIFLIAHFMRTIPSNLLMGNPQAAATKIELHTGPFGFIKSFLSGFTLMATRPYLLGVLLITVIYEVAAEIIKFQMKAYAALSPEYGSPLAFCSFMGIFGVSVNGISLLIALMGTRGIIKKIGLQQTLLLLPVSFALSLIFLWLYIGVAATPVQLLWATFIVTVVIKSLGYAINNPAKEIMYIPTSREAQFKTKAWIETFGFRSAQTGGAAITGKFKDNLAQLTFYGMLISFGVIGIGLCAALYVGKKNKELLENDQIIQ